MNHAIAPCGTAAMHPSERSSKSASPTKRTWSSPLRRPSPSGWLSAKRVNLGRVRRGRAEALEVDVQRGPIVQRVDAVAGAAGDEHGFADPAPAVLDADPERRVRPERHADDGVAEDLIAVEHERLPHREIIPGAPADERDRRAGDVVGAADDLLLVAGEAVAEQEQRAVRTRLGRVQAARDLRARLAQSLRRARRHRGADREPGARRARAPPRRGHRARRWRSRRPSSSPRAARRRPRSRRATPRSRARGRRRRSAGARRRDRRARRSRPRPRPWPNPSRPIDRLRPSAQSSIR